MHLDMPSKFDAQAPTLSKGTHCSAYSCEVEPPREARAASTSWGPVTAALPRPSYAILPSTHVRGLGLATNAELRRTAPAALLVLLLRSWVLLLIWAGEAPAGLQHERIAELLCSRLHICL